MEKLIAFLVAHWPITLIFVTALLLFFVNEVFGVILGVPKLNSTALTDQINRKTIDLIDLRPEGDYASGHILGAVNIPLRTVKEKIAKLDKSKAIVLVDAAGQQAAAVGASLRKQGFSKISYLAGGMNSWRADGLPINK